MISDIESVEVLKVPREHGASKSGQKAEEFFRDKINQNERYSCLRTIDDFILFYGNKEEGRKKYYDKFRHKYPSLYMEEFGVSYKKDGKEREYIVDFYIPEIDQIIELKYFSQEGTTEEKVFYDLEKIRDGAYKYRPLYLFLGTNCKNVNEFKIFAGKAQKENLNVDVLFEEDKENLSAVFEFLDNKKRQLTKN